MFKTPSLSKFSGSIVKFAELKPEHKWNQYNSSSPLEDLENLTNAFIEQVGYFPDHVLIPFKVKKHLIKNKSLKNRMEVLRGCSNLGMSDFMIETTFGILELAPPKYLSSDLSIWGEDSIVLFSETYICIQKVI